jgi:transcriptional regulator with XRE-family HTH domain
MNVRQVGAYIRSQRLSSRLSLKNVSGLAGISIPYLSQVERGLRKPSADILQAIAKALRISAETLYVQAGILESHPVPDVASAIMADPSVTERQKQALIQIYEAFREETGRDLLPRAHPGVATAASRGSTVTPARTARARSATTKRSSVEAGGGAKTKAGNSPHPAPLRSPATNRRKEV